MAESIVATVVETLGGLLIEEAKFLSGVTDQVEEVRRELKRMQCFLRDADARGSTNETVRNWLREIKSLIYRVEDIVEAFAVEVVAKRGKGVKKVLSRFACILCEGRSLHNLGLEIAKVKNDISNLTTSLQSYDIRAISEAESSVVTTNEDHKWARQTYAHEVGDYFVGMEQDIRKLVSLVVDSKDRATISIWGMGGLGKTTIARKIYKHRDVQRCFERFAWVCITQQAQIKGILQDVFMQLCPDKKDQVKSMTDRELVEQLYRVQKETKCLVVLDDLWHMRDWENLDHAFPIVEGGSKILITTRKKEVAEIGFPYPLKCLKDEESWELLKLIAFSRKEIEGYDPTLENVGVEMVRKCGGLPLAVCVLGGLLKDKNSLRDWQIVNENIDSYLSTGKGSEGGSRGSRAIGRVLSLSYNDLPYHLKPCFLYLGKFREDEDMYAEELYLLWMAEGMVLSQHRRRGETLMEVAERYLDELVQRSMVQVQVDEISISRRFRSCRLHDMMRDFCLEKGSEEEFIGVIDLRGVQEPSSDSFSPINNAAYRLVIHVKRIDAVGTPTNAYSYTASKEDYKQLRSLLFRINDYNPVVPQEIKVDYLKFKSLRVLKFEWYDFGGKKLPEGLEKLIHLRFLGFTWCGGLDEIPSSIAKLPFLQTLDLRRTVVAKMPNNLGKMKRLRHLFLPYVEVNEKLRLTGLRELESLHENDINSIEVADLHELRNLRSLTVTVADDESLCGVINYLRSMNGQNLQETGVWITYGVSFSSEQGYVLLTKILACEKLNRLTLRVKISKFPQYEEHFLQGLVYLALMSTNIEEDPMKMLEKLPQLRSLSFSYDSYVGTDMICHESGFPQLRCLILTYLLKLRRWRVEKGGMPNLSHLEIEGCPMLEMIPEGLKYVAGLKELIINWMSPTFVDRIMSKDGGGEGEDFDKIRHVPSIAINHLPGGISRRTALGFYNHFDLLRWVSHRILFYCLFILIFLCLINNLIIRILINHLIGVVIVSLCYKEGAKQEQIGNASSESYKHVRGRGIR